MQKEELHYSMNLTVGCRRLSDIACQIISHATESTRVDVTSDICYMKQYIWLSLIVDR